MDLKHTFNGFTMDMRGIKVDTNELSCQTTAGSSEWEQGWVGWLQVAAAW